MKKNLLAAVLVMTAAPIFAASIDITNAYECDLQYHFATALSTKVGKVHYIKKGDTHKDINIPKTATSLRVDLTGGECRECPRLSCEESINLEQVKTGHVMIYADSNDYLALKAIAELPEDE